MVIEKLTDELKDLLELLFATKKERWRRDSPEKLSQELFTKLVALNIFLLLSHQSCNEHFIDTQNSPI